MTHEGRMARGKLKLARNFNDSETQYYLDNKPEEPKEEPKKEAKKDGKPKSG